MHRLVALLVVMWLASSPAALAAPAEKFAAANQAFSDGEFQSAYNSYQALLDDGHLNADLLYNLGNASYRLERPGEAVLWYERTLTLDPTPKEAKQNLRFLKRTSGILQFEPVAYEPLINWIRRDDLLRIASVAGWLAVLGIAAALTLRLRRGLNTTLWLCSPLFATVALAAGIGIFLKHKRQSNLDTRAIVVAADVKALTAPARSAASVIELPPGSQISIVSNRDDWDYIDVPGELRAWVPADSLKPLWPYESSLAD